MVCTSLYLLFLMQQVHFSLTRNYINDAHFQFYCYFLSYAFQMDIMFNDDIIFLKQKRIWENTNLWNCIVTVHYHPLKLLRSYVHWFITSDLCIIFETPCFIAYLSVYWYLSIATFCVNIKAIIIVMPKVSFPRNNWTAILLDLI